MPQQLWGVVWLVGDEEMRKFGREQLHQNTTGTGIAIAQWHLRECGSILIYDRPMALSGMQF